MTVDLYIWEQKEPLRSILDYLHQLIIHLSTDIEYTIKWKVPYYSIHNAILYINPIKKKSGQVEICFARARRFELGKELLDFKGRKVVGGYIITSLEDIDEQALTMLIKESIRVDKIHRDSSPWKA